MKHFLAIFSIGVCVMVLGAAHAALGADPATVDGRHFILNTFRLLFAEYRVCQTVDKREGVCVPDYACDDEYNIGMGGIIDKNDVRIGNCLDLKWCCVHPNMSLFTNTTLKPAPRGCRTGQRDSCPWCVAVYWNSPTRHSPDLICGGAIVGSRAVLTSATCALAHRKSHVWVTLPGSRRKYRVESTIKHRQYSPGTREHDIALLLLTEDIEWPEGPKDDQGACLGLRTPLEGECVAIGFDEADQLKFTPLTVTAKSCSPRDSSYDAACGRPSGTCAVAQGSPVLCQSDTAEWIVAGVTRQVCIKDTTALGSLVSSAEWITEQLTKLSLAADRYTISG